LIFLKKSSKKIKECFENKTRKMEWLLCEFSIYSQSHGLNKGPEHWFKVFQSVLNTNEHTKKLIQDENVVQYLLHIIEMTSGLLHEQEITQFLLKIFNILDYPERHSFLSRLKVPLNYIHLDNTPESRKLMRLFVITIMDGKYSKDRVVIQDVNYKLSDPLLYNISLSETSTRLLVYVKDKKIDLDDILLNVFTYFDPEIMRDFHGGLIARKELLRHMQHNAVHVPFLNKVLPKFNDDDIATLCMTLPNTSQNLYALLHFIKTWDPSTTFAQQCKYDLLRSTPIEYVQVIFAHMACWWDSSRDPCKTCTLNWRHFLPQWRCTALCKSKKRIPEHRCWRFAKPGELYCSQHIITHQFNRHVKPYSTSNTPGHDPGPDAYKTEPRGEIDIFVRYPLTLRVVTSLGTFHHRRDVWKPDGFYLPVVRYESLYYSDLKETTDISSRQYCGKFFFYEPDSSMFVHLRNAQIFASKVHAAMDLWKKYFDKFSRYPPYFLDPFGVITEPFDIHDDFWDPKFQHLSKEFFFSFSHAVFIF